MKNPYFLTRDELRAAASAASSVQVDSIIASLDGRMLTEAEAYAAGYAHGEYQILFTIENVESRMAGATQYDKIVTRAAVEIGAALGDYNASLQMLAALPHLIDFEQIKMVFIQAIQSEPKPLEALMLVIQSGGTRRLTEALGAEYLEEWKRYVEEMQAGDIKAVPPSVRGIRAKECARA